MNQNNLIFQTSRYERANFKVDRNSEKYGTSIIAHSGLWHHDASTNTSLENPPSSGEIYTITIYGAVLLSINQKIWIFFESAESWFDGIETISALEKIRFCFGEVCNLVALDVHSATIKFKIIECINYHEVLERSAPASLQKGWLEMFESACNYFSGDEGHHFFKGDNFYNIFCSFGQSAFGQQCILTEYNNYFVAPIIKIWDGADEVVYGGMFEIPEHLLQSFFKVAISWFRIFIDNKLVLNLFEPEYYRSETMKDWVTRKVHEIGEQIDNGARIKIGPLQLSTDSIKSSTELYQWFMEHYQFSEKS